MSSCQRSMRNPHGKKSVWKELGVDITDRITFRSLRSDERNQPENAGAESAPHNGTIASRLPSSMRDEAIWQYHAGRGRGLVFWGERHHFRYVPLSGRTRTGPVARPELEPAVIRELESYDPVNEALLCSQIADGFSYFRIASDGALFPLR